MNTPILSTKLHIPSPRCKLVGRLRLIDRLNAGIDRKMTLLSAPAGFGKTTLISEWIVQSGRACAWLSLSEDDNDPTRFLTYFISALQTIIPKVGEGLLYTFQSKQLQMKSVLTALINELSAAPHPFVLVLDDYHVIKHSSIHGILHFLLEHLPLQMHVVISSREDLPFSLSRLRAGNQLTELRMSDLRFTFSEALEFFRDVMQLPLTPDEVEILEVRTEGWIAALQMAAISMEGRKDIPRFIQQFTGNHRYIVDYLVEEILQNLPDHVRDFLLQVSILDRLYSSLCQAVTGKADSRELLETLERGNLFMIPLDDQRQWYRFHYLFTEVLRTRIREERSEQVPILHRRAADWYEEHGQRSEAIHHALAAEDFDYASNLIVMAWPDMRRTRQQATVLDWMKKLPEEWIRRYPVLHVSYAWALLEEGQLTAAEVRLQDAERWMQHRIDTDEQFSAIPASVANARAFLSQAKGDIDGCIKYARQALELLPEGDDYEIGTTEALLGIAYWTKGNVEAAYRSFSNGLSTLRRGGNLIVVCGTFILADMGKELGRLHEAAQIYSQSLKLAEERGEPYPQGTAELYIGFSDLHMEWGNVEAARLYLSKGKSIIGQASLPGNEYLWNKMQARMEQVEGSILGALNQLYEAEQLYKPGPIPNLYPLAAARARLWAAAGKLDQAIHWASECRLTIEDDLSYLREYEHITLARVLISRYKHEYKEHFLKDAARLLNRLLLAAEEGKRMRSVIEILILQAMVLQARGDGSAALVPLKRALTLAEPEEYVSIFVAEGPPMEALLLEFSRQGKVSKYVLELLSAFSPDRKPLVSVLAEPLTERERNVLALFETDLRGPEIARELNMSLNTMRTHTKNIYNKLAVNNRRAAVLRAKELHLL